MITRSSTYHTPHATWLATQSESNVKCSVASGFCSFSVTGYCNLVHWELMMHYIPEGNTNFWYKILWWRHLKRTVKKIMIQTKMVLVRLSGAVLSSQISVAGITSCAQLHLLWGQYRKWKVTVRLQMIRLKTEKYNPMWNFHVLGTSIQETTIFGQLSLEKFSRAARSFSLEAYSKILLYMCTNSHDSLMCIYWWPIGFSYWSVLH